jgi:hypothetical protein
MSTSRAVYAVIVAVAVGGGFAACAQGNQLTLGTGGQTTKSSSSSSGMGNASGTGGMSSSGAMIGSPCPDGKCVQGTCTLVGTTKYCTTACPPTCPTGTYCSVIDGNPTCVPDLGQQCDKCTQATDCKLPSDACLTAPLGDTFCARDCSIDGLCPNGFTCLPSTTYESDAGFPEGGGAGGAGSGSTSSSTTGSSSGTGGTGGGAGGSDGGLGPFPTAPDKWCVPDDGASCPCNAKRDGVTNTCTNMNTFGTCTGTETCNGAAFEWQNCNATAATAEVCNGKDDNCNGQIDEGDPNMLCASMGAQPPNASWACTDGTCQLGACSPGWAAFPTGSVSTGCTCPVDTAGQTCATAMNVGMVTSVGGAPLTISGTLSSATDVDVYTFNTVDTTQAGTNSYHVTITFTQPMANTEFVMDVERGACSDTPNGGATNVTSYDWCVNATGATSGEAPCGPTDVHHCTDHSSVYYVRVYRAASVTTPTCTPYQLTVTGGAGTCDLTQTCM